jgi:acyl-CoA thioesterase I
MVFKQGYDVSYLERQSASNPLHAALRLVGAFTLLGALWMTQLTTAASQNAQNEQNEKVLNLVALGDSLTAGYGLAPQDGFTAQLQAALTAKGLAVKVHNGGVSGDTSAGGLARLEWVVGPDTHAVIVELGANDMLRGLAPALTEKNLRLIIERLQAKGVEVMLAGMLATPNLGPLYESRFNRLYPQLAEEYGLVFYPFFLDGVAANPKLNLDDRIHPNRAGIAVIVEKILPTVERLLARITS